MLNYIREGDIVVVTELDRLGRNNKELTLVMNEIQQKGATFFTFCGRDEFTGKTKILSSKHLKFDIAKIEYD